jgi:hypothetical protein
MSGRDLTRFTTVLDDSMELHTEQFEIHGVDLDSRNP